MDNTILALDLARRFGWAEGRPGETPRFGSDKFAGDGASQEEQFAGAVKWLGTRLLAFKPRIIVYEEPELFRLRSGKATKATIEVLFGLPAVIQGVAYRMGVTTIRKAMANDVRGYFIGTRRLKRAEAKIATVRACKALGWDVRNDDEGDACAIWAYMAAVIEPGLRREPPLNFDKERS